MDSVILKALRVRGLAAAGALLVAAACGGGDDAKGASATPAAGDSPAVAGVGPAAAAAPNAAQQPAPAAQPNASVLDSAMTPAEATKAAPALQGPVNVEVINGYQLSMDRLRKVVQGGQNLAALQARRPDLRDSMAIPTMDPNAVYERLNAVPEARAAIGQAGLTPREYATATGALIQAAMVYEMRRVGRQPQGEVNEGNVKFVADHWEEIQSMMRAAAPRSQGQPGQPQS